MKKIFLIAAVLFSAALHAQVSKVSLQASGLTCSMCSNSINKSLQSLQYVDKVMSDIKTSTFNISFKPGANVNFDQLKKKVEDAGFFVANLKAVIQFNDLLIEKDNHYNVAGMNLHFLNAAGQKLSGEQTISVVDKGYVSAKIFKKNNSFTNMECYKTGVAGTCRKKTGLAEGSRIFHVTI